MTFHSCPRRGALFLLPSREGSRVSTLRPGGASRVYIVRPRAHLDVGRRGERFPGLAADHVLILRERARERERDAAGQSRDARVGETRRASSSSRCDARVRFRERVPWARCSPVSSTFPFPSSLVVPPRVFSPRRRRVSPRVSPCSFYCCSPCFSVTTTTTTTRAVVPWSVSRTRSSFSFLSSCRRTRARARARARRRRAPRARMGTARASACRASRAISDDATRTRTTTRTRTRLDET